MIVSDVCPAAMHRGSDSGAVQHSAGLYQAVPSSKHAQDQLEGEAVLLGHTAWLKRLGTWASHASESSRKAWQACKACAGGCKVTGVCCLTAWKSIAACRDLNCRC